MKIKNHTPSHKVKHSKSLLSSTIEYIKNEYYNDEKLAIQSNKIINKKGKEKGTKNKNIKKIQNSNLNSKNLEMNTEQINQKKSKP